MTFKIPSLRGSKAEGTISFKGLQGLINEIASSFVSLTPRNDGILAKKEKTMATIKTNKMFDENGILTPEALLIINDSAFLADMAYKDGKELENLSKPLNKNSPEQPLKSKDGYIIIENLDTVIKFEVVEVYEGSNGLNLSKNLKISA